MAAHVIAINEIELRSAAVTMSAGRVISSVSRNTSIALKHYRVLLGLNTVIDSANRLLQAFHVPNSIKALETTPIEQRIVLGERIKDSHNKVRVMIATLRTLRLGYWERLYTSRISTLEALNSELGVHADSLRDEHAAFVLLSKRDQEFVIEALLNPREPSEELRNLFARK